MSSTSPIPPVNFEQWDFLHPSLLNAFRRTTWVTPEVFHSTRMRKASLMDLHGYYVGEDAPPLSSLSPDSPEYRLTSWFGEVLVALPHEVWPRNGATPMMPLCQFRLTELPFCPDYLSDMALLTIFLDADDTPHYDPNGQKWELRAYPQERLNDLVPLEKPTLPSVEDWTLVPQRPRWQVIEDFPTFFAALGDTLPILEGSDSFESMDDYWFAYTRQFENHAGTKIGGWPTPLQGSPCWLHPTLYTPPDDLEYAFQIDAEEGWTWGDVGCSYFGRGMRENRHVWMLDWTCC